VLELGFQSRLTEWEEGELELEVEADVEIGVEVEVVVVVVVELEVVVLAEPERASFTGAGRAAEARETVVEELPVEVG
jgi:hypothetical protein